MAGSPVILTPSTIDLYDPGGGALPLSSYRVGGEVVARNITSFEVTLLPDPDRLFRILIRGEKKRQGEIQERELLTTSVHFRN